jgi:integrase
VSATALVAISSAVGLIDLRRGRDQALPNRPTIKRTCDYAILALLVGCALRRQELAQLDVETIQMREGRWVIVDLHGKGGRGWLKAFTRLRSPCNLDSGIDLMH